MWEAGKSGVGLSIQAVRLPAHGYYAFDTENENLGKFDIEDQQKKIVHRHVRGYMLFVSSFWFLPNGNTLK
ncbi:hypothetical protein [Chryseobacterium indoltheticum]|uniref:hypothetical protein n=1 Tax=Chryseobacterium indoltheticum TaxID=254 RepID=UPI003F490D27